MFCECGSRGCCVEYCKGWEGLKGDRGTFSGRLHLGGSWEHRRWLGDQRQWPQPQEARLS